MGPSLKATPIFRGGFHRHFHVANPLGRYFASVSAQSWIARQRVTRYVSTGRFDPRSRREM
jgi:hypothetical protein